MMTQSQIYRTLCNAGAEDRIVGILSRQRFDSRSALGRRVCREFGFSDGRGRLQLAGCLKALLALSTTSDRIVLPARQRSPVRSAPVLLASCVASAEQVPGRLDEVRDLAVIAVSGRDHRRIWNTLIAREHPRGMAIFAGCQMRYLVASGHGYLGAVWFSASALRVAARDRWIGWSDGQREAHLHRVVCLNRFLVRPGVRCMNLASHVLGHVLRRLPGDFEDRYGYRPWLVETFVERCHDGASLRAGNFVAVGETAGRGRQDRGHRHEETVKSVYMYELQSGWRRRLGVVFVDPAPCLEPGSGLDSAVWAENEFGRASLGDKRLTARLIKSAALLADYPGRAITGTAKSDAAAVDGYYRFIEQPADSQVTVENILAPHRARSVQRMRRQDTVLCLQDGSDLNFATRPGCAGLRIIGRNQTSARTLGLHLHATLAVNPQGLPLGVLRCGFDPAGKDDAGHKMRRWIDGYRDIAEAARGLTRRTQVISVMDREADFFELFDEQRRQGRVEILVRAKHDRCLEDRKRKLFSAMSGGDADGLVEVEISALTERLKSSRKQARPARRKRLARCETRFRKLTLPATIENADPVTLSGVHVVETHPPEGEKPVQWYLLTSLAVDDAETAAGIVGYYLQRWRIEDFFRVLKFGCRVEFLAFRTADRLQRAIAINSVIAWRIMLMTLLGRQVPECGANLMFTDHELNFLHDYAVQYGLSAPANLGDTVRLVAHLGGYRDRKHDPDPGNQIMWHGYDTLSKATLGHRIGFEGGKRHALENATKPIVT